MSKWCYQVRVPMLKAKIWPKTTKSSHNKVPVKAASQPEFRTQKILRGDGTHRGGGTDPSNFFSPMNSNFGEIWEK